MGLLDEINRLSTKQYNSQEFSQPGPSKPIREQQQSQSNQHLSQTITLLDDDELEEYLDNGMTLSSQRTGKERTTEISQKQKLYGGDDDDLVNLAPSKIEMMSTEELRETVNRFGFRPSKSKSVMKGQLEKIYEALLSKRSKLTSIDGGDGIGDTSSIFSSSPPSSILFQPSPTPGRQKGKPVKGIATINLDSDLSAIHSDTEMPLEVGDLTLEMMREQDKAKERRKPNGNRSCSDDDDAESLEGEMAMHSQYSSGDDVDEEEDDNEEEAGNTSLRGVIRSSSITSSQAGALGTVPADVAKQLHDIIIADKDLYKRILLFEPISFDEVNSLAKKAGVQGLRNKETLRNWLDVQCICFYTAELTGRRQRY